MILLGSFWWLEKSRKQEPKKFNLSTFSIVASRVHNEDHDFNEGLHLKVRQTQPQCKEFWISYQSKNSYSKGTNQNW